MNSKVSLIRWADSQQCMDCIHGTFVMAGVADDEEKIGSTVHICWKSVFPFTEECNAIRETGENKDVD